MCEVPLSTPRQTPRLSFSLSGLCVPRVAQVEHPVAVHLPNTTINVYVVYIRHTAEGGCNEDGGLEGIPH